MGIDDNLGVVVLAFVGIVNPDFDPFVAGCGTQTHRFMRLRSEVGRRPRYAVNRLVVGVLYKGASPFILLLLDYGK